MPTASRVESVEVALVVSPKRPRPAAAAVVAEEYDSAEHCKSPSAWSADADDLQDLLHSAHQDVLDQWEALVEREGNQAYALAELPEDFLRQRGKIGNWYYKIVDHEYYNIDRSCVAIALAYFDRLVSHGLVERSSWHIAAATCLFMAVKIHAPVTLTSRMMVEILRGVFEEEDFLEMEYHILHALEWHVNPPIASQFVEILRPLLENEPMGDHDFGADGSIVIDDQARHQLLTTSTYLCELGAMDAELAGAFPSALGCAAVHCALDVLQFPVQASHWLNSHDLDVDPEETTDCIERLHALMEETGFEPEFVLECTSEEDTKAEEGKEHPVRAVTPTKEDVPPSIKRVRQETIVDGLIDSYVGKEVQQPSPKKRRTV